jgi:hypothetical protein
VSMIIVVTSNNCQHVVLNIKQPWKVRSHWTMSYEKRKPTFDQVSMSTYTSTSFHTCSKDETL